MSHCFPPVCFINSYKLEEFLGQSPDSARRAHDWHVSSIGMGSEGTGNTSMP